MKHCVVTDNFNWSFGIKLFCQQMHYLLKHKILQFVFKYLWLLHVSVPLDHHQGAYIGTLLKFVVCALGAVRHLLPN
jgi:hypothetical protein